jgi:hypothetical protein
VHILDCGIQEALVNEMNNVCAVCGLSGDVAPLQVSHFWPKAFGSESSEDNVVLLCAKCNSEDSRPPELEFVAFMSDILQRHPLFTDVRQEALIGQETRYRADIMVRRRASTGYDTLLIDCKTGPILSGGLRDVVSRLHKYQRICGECLPVLAIPATLTERDSQLLAEAEIEVWGLEYIARSFASQIASADPSYYRALFKARLHRRAELTAEQKLIRTLKATQPGKKDCAVYQSVVGDILELLFCPPLSKPLCEHSDKAQANRRDFILPNYADSGFWRSIRERYGADYIVVDAKNFTGKITKTEVLQIANYLKPHGAGLLALIVCRTGGDSRGCDITLREQWLIHRKLILILDDHEIEEMLVAKSDGRPPEEIIGRRIERFRLSM